MRIFAPFLLFVLLVGSSCLAFGQQNDIPLQRDFYIDVERNAALPGSRVHSGLKPVIESRADLTNVMGHRIDSTRYYYWATEKLFRDNLVVVKGDGYRLTLDLLFQLEYGSDPGDPTPYADTNRFVHNTRGFRVTGDLGGKVSFQTMFHENQAVVPQYLFNAAGSTRVMPGQGRVKVVNNTKLDYGWSQASLSYSPSAWLNVQLGHGRHFVGHGYRSVLMSDHTIGHPYIKFSAQTLDRRLQYTTWHAKLMHGVTEADRMPTGESSESQFFWMRGRFNHVSYSMDRIDVGLFESTLFQTIGEDGVLPFDPLELNPIIGMNTLLTGFDAVNKSLVGVDLRVKVLGRTYAYGQLATDGPGDGRLAWQAGVRLFDVLRRDTHVQLEYNAAKPFMYMHDPVRESYMHGGLPLAHPMGAYFNEAVAIVDHGMGRYRLQGKVNMATYQRDRTSTENNGSNLNKPDIASPGTDGPLRQQLFFLDLNASYLFNPVSNLRFVLGVMRRDLSNAADAAQSTYIYASLRTSLFNRYYDI